MILQTIILFFQKLGEEIQYSQWWHQNGGRFQNHRNKLFIGRPISRVHAQPFIFMLAILLSLVALFVLVPS